MRYPAMRAQPTRSVCISKPDGGLNLRDGLSQCLDSQLTDALNIWYEGGELRTRPALCERAADIKKAGSLRESLNGDAVSSGTTDIYYELNGSTYRLFRYSFYDENLDKTFFEFRFVSEKGIFELPAITVSGKHTASFVVQHKRALYTFIGENGVWSYNENDEAWKQLGDEDFYAPLVMTHCKPASDDIMWFATAADIDGVTAEGYNLLSTRYRLIYSTVDKERLTGDNKHLMIYYLTQSINEKEFEGKTVEAVITDKSGKKYTHRLTLSGSSVAAMEESDPGDGMLMQIVGSTILFGKRGSDGNFETNKIGASDYVEDNLEITAPCRQLAKEKVMNMTKAVWFGGAAAGLSGGTRLFLGGNTNAAEQSLVLWSDLNNPLYFPENCYAYVGNVNTPVTAFGKQNDSLVIFKSNETFCTQYTSGSSISAAEFVSSGGTDLTSATVYFPMTQLNSAIGCDCPDTVQLCRNRLVWATSGGKVYTLLSQSQYNERNIFEISEMIEARLGEQAEIKNGTALSADWKGKYIIFCGSGAFIMEYNSYGFIYAASHAKTEDANLRIPWFYWEFSYDDVSPLPFGALASVMTVGNDLKINYLFEAAETNGDSHTYSYYMKTAGLSEKETEDICILPGEHGDWDAEERLPIKTLVRTKVFDFGAPAARKHIPLIQLDIGDNGGEPLTVSYITEFSERKYDDIVYPPSYDEGRGKYSGVAVLRPAVRFCRIFGLEISCDSAMALRSITVYYRTTGGVK